MMYQHNFFEKTAKKFPNAIAVDDHGKKISYKQLNIFANKIANLIVSSNFSTNERICILTKKNINLYASILGILKSGGCWIPLSNQFPKSRINFLIKFNSPKIVIIEKEFLHLIKKDKKIKIIVIDDNSVSRSHFTKKDIIQQMNTAPNIKNLNLSNLAYIIYTSGSTGQPKGVTVTHLNTSTYIYNSKKYFKVKKKMKFAHISEIIFDPSIFDIFVCWFNCGTVVPMNKKEYKVDLIKFFKKNRNINICFVVPSFFKKIDEMDQLKSKYLKKLKHVVFGGEFLSHDLVKKLMLTLPKTKFYNVYGTTETAIISHWHLIKKKDLSLSSIPVGKQIPEINTILLKNDKEISEINKPGKAHVYGPQVSNGYWNSKFLNDKFFIKNLTNKSIYEKLYNTGDFLIKDKNDIFFYHGRQDFQIKIRGHRVEIEEIENIFRSRDYCKDICVVPFSRGDSKLYTDLIFYIQRDDKVKKNKEYFFNISKKLMPNYMQPTFIITLDEDFPRNINGKIDKKALKRNFFTKIA